MGRIITFLALIAALLLLVVPISYAQDEESGDEVLGEIIEEEEKPAEDPNQEDKPAMSNLPLNFYGRSGLILTSATHVLELFDVEPGIGFMYENSGDPEYTKQIYAFNVALGLPHHFMLFVHAPYVMSDLKYGERWNALRVKERAFSNESMAGMGSVEGGFQWAFFMQDRFLPGMAAGISFLAPGSEYDNKISLVKNFGVKANVAMSLEIVDLFFTEYVFAIFADGSIIIRDPLVEDRDYEEKRALVHGGMLFPLHPRNFVNLLIEYEGELMTETTNDEDTNGFVGGLRFITNRIGVTAGAEYVFKEADDMEDTIRFLGTASYRFW